MSKMSNRARVNAAIDRAECAATELITVMEMHGQQDSVHTKAAHRRELLRMARRYAGAMDAVTRVRSRVSK